MNITRYFKALGDETRLRLFHLLLHYELNVNELVLIMQMGQSRISRHLKVLSENDLLRQRRDGGFSYYQVPNNASLESLVNFVKNNLSGEETATEDLSRAQAIIKERKNKTRRFFNQIAEHWERLKRDVLGDLDLAGTVSDEIPVCATAADLGCGTGELLLKLLSKAETVIGVDHSPQMLKMARLKLDAEDVAARSDLRLGELEHLPLRDQEGDAAVINMVLHHIPLPQAGIKEANRVLRPGGTLIIADFAKHSREDIREKFGATWLGFEADDIETWLTAAGFSLLGSRQYPVRHGMAVNVFRAVKDHEPQAT
jgi:ArsR family transcriptional regulator